MFSWGPVNAANKFPSTLHSISVLDSKGIKGISSAINLQTGLFYGNSAACFGVCSMTIIQGVKNGSLCLFQSRPCSFAHIFSLSFAPHLPFKGNGFRDHADSFTTILKPEINAENGFEDAHSIPISTSKSKI